VGDPSADRRRVEAPVIRGRPLVAVAVATVVVLGLNWPIMTWGLESIAPLWLTSFRLVGAGVGLAVILAVTGHLKLPPRGDLPVVASVAVLRLAVVYALVFSALLLVPPGRSSMLVHTTGLWIAPLGAWLLGELLTGRKVAGLVIGVGGIVLLMEPWGAEAGEGGLAGYAMLLGAAISTAFAGIHVRGHRWTASPLMLMPWQLIVAGLITIPVAVALHGPPSFAWTTREVAVVGYQVVLASGFGVWGILTLGRSLPAATSGAVWMAVPAVGVASSILLVDERLTVLALTGMLLVAAGVWLAVSADRPRSATPPASA
jgi:drug/metabolite transporter (DMT)-like permease